MQYMKSMVKHQHIHKSGSQSEMKTFLNLYEDSSGKSSTMLSRSATSGLKYQNMNKEPTAAYVEKWRT
jgi:hypothetical protein